MERTNNALRTPFFFNENSESKKMATVSVAVISGAKDVYKRQDLGGFLPSLFFFRNGIMGVISLHKQCIVIAGLVRTHLRANKARLKAVPQDLFSPLTVLLIHGQKEHGQQDRHHAEGSAGIACGIPQDKEQRQDVYKRQPLYSRGNSPRLTMSIQLMRT